MNRDDAKRGATWRSTTVLRKDGNSCQALLWHPEPADTNGCVTLGAEAWDAPWATAPWATAPSGPSPGPTP